MIIPNILEIENVLNHHPDKITHIYEKLPNIFSFQDRLSCQTVIFYPKEQIWYPVDEAGASWVPIQEIPKGSIWYPLVGTFQVAA